MKNTFSVLLATLMKQNYKGLISAFKENKKKQITYILLSLLIAVPLLVILVLVGYSVAGVTAEMGIFDAFADDGKSTYRDILWNVRVYVRYVLFKG